MGVGWVAELVKEHEGAVNVGVVYPGQFGKHPPQVWPHASKKSSQSVDVHVSVGVGEVTEFVREQDGAVKVGVLDPGQFAKHPPYV